LLAGCAPDAPVDGRPDVCDAGDTAWAERAIPLVWGRKARGAAEVRVWADAAAEVGRDTAVRAMTRSPEYVDRWQSWLTDALWVARTGDREYGACFAEPLLPTDQGELARWLAETPAAGSDWGTPFNMADVIRSSLQADDLSAPWRVNLYARMNRPLQGANVGPREMEESRRQAFGETFDHTYLYRDMVCLSCHNSHVSVTDAEDPAEDRFWPLPGLFELALYGSHYGADEDTAYQPWRYAGLMDQAVSVEAPWGIAEACGRFAPPEALGEDYLGHEGYFVEAFGETGSVWSVEPLLAVGVTSLAGRGLAVGEGGEVDGPEAFAYLVAANIVDQVWQEALGERLTIATYFPRNEAQRDRLGALADPFVETRFSLRELLVDIATDPIFAAGGPATCESRPYGMEPVVNPWSREDEDPERQGNSAGDLVHRHGARVLVRSVHASMGWAQPDPFLASSDPLARLQSALGAFSRESQPGFRGTDFQGALAFEAAYGACEAPDPGGAGNGCDPTPAYGGCASCDCQGCVCQLDPYCCDVQWDEACVAMCEDSCGGCGGGLAEPRADTVDRILADVRAADGSVRDVVLALKDRLVARGIQSTDEELLIASLLGAPLDTPLSSLGDLEGNLRVLCGAILLSPDFFLVMDHGELGEVPGFALDVALVCDEARALLAMEGVEVTCGS